LGGAIEEQKKEEVRDLVFGFWSTDLIYHLL
jgi:hypothetical protein